MASTADFGSADWGSIPYSPANSWVLLTCYGDDFYGCPSDDDENVVQCSEPDDRTADDETGCEPSPKR